MVNVSFFYIEQNLSYLQAKERARRLRADLAVEEHRVRELDRILREVLPYPKTPNIPKSRPSRKVGSFHIIFTPHVTLDVSIPLLMNPKHGYSLALKEKGCRNVLQKMPRLILTSVYHYQHSIVRTFHLKRILRSVWLVHLLHLV
ncbi:hypothetical protein RYX36_010137 [Vicia faba]